MALDRDAIERKDFPIGRRGYDPDAVDAHLSALAGEVEELRRASRTRTETLAATASEHVRAIVEAAGSSAAQIQRRAEAQAQEIRGEASADAAAARLQATRTASESIATISQATASMLERLEAIQVELTELMQDVLARADRLNAGIQELESSLEEVRGAAASQLRPETERPEPVAGTSAGPSSLVGELGIDEVEPQLGSDKVHGDALAGDLDAARLIALNMALNGSSREETERYLAENFKLRDRRGLVEDVYASVEG
jgi:DivIVA domain-containing protein